MTQDPIALPNEPESQLGQWQRMHPVTPLLKGWQALVLLIIIIFNSLANAGDLWELMQRIPVLWVVFVFVLFIVLAVVINLVVWRAAQYCLEPQLLRLHSGVIFKNQREAPLDRVEAVDVVQPIIARIFGLAKIRVEVAGGLNSKIELAYLKEQEARDLRDRILAQISLAKTHRRDTGAASVQDSGLPESAGHPAKPQDSAAVTGDAALDTAGHAAFDVSGDASGDTAGEQSAIRVGPQPGRAENWKFELYHVPAGDIIKGNLRSIATILSALAIIVAIGYAVLRQTIAGLLPILPVILGAGGVLWSRFVTDFNFKAEIASNGIRLRHGMLETVNATVPPLRVQAIQMSQGILWRKPDYWRVEFNLAGYGLSMDAYDVLLPVGSREKAFLAIWSVLPDFGTENPIEVITAAMETSGDNEFFTGTPKRAWWLNPVTWRRNAYAITDRAVILRKGRVTRKVSIIPHERIQSFELSQGPLQRRAGVATVTLHSTGGSVDTATGSLHGQQGLQLLVEQLERSRNARRIEDNAQWLQMLDDHDQVPVDLTEISEPSAENSHAAHSQTEPKIAEDDQ